MISSQQKSEYVRARIEPKMKAEAEAVLSELGLTMSDAIRLFVNQISLRQAFPIELKIPNAETLKAIEAPVTDEVFTSFDDLVKAVEKLDV